MLSIHSKLILSAYGLTKTEGDRKQPTNKLEKDAALRLRSKYHDDEHNYDDVESSAARMNHHGFDDESFVNKVDTSATMDDAHGE